ncbi:MULTISPECIES: RNase adapter RapZ [unclassified Gemella]|uniref:RNase adapter RapZ n=1 Tax=unclassified Gemella TaxID=2624949 RepID=UPI001C050AD7|nr:MULTISPECIES: RNase adapter RapZ [unclassified Gemella]MBU0278946.1 RNase adapter RapZ [Gemella sp. zg-1178]QWQ39055.1 RNase adapter RapZ [Gemella sp. zg-570]
MKKDLVIITGLSGAGKNSALDVFEDFGYFCVDNMPSLLVDAFLKLLIEKDITKAAISIDIRSKKFSLELGTMLQNILKDDNFNIKIIYIDCSDEVLVNRYKETRKNHPLSKKSNLLDGIRAERELMKNIRVNANYIYDTSKLKVKDLIEKISQDFSIKKLDRYHVTVSSFGYKYGIPIDADNIIDVRFLRNPFYIDELKEKTGLEEDVYNYVMADDTSQEFYDNLKKLILFMIEKYQYEGRDKIAIAVGCTGGKHRSVSIARKLFEDIKKEGYTTYISHRDINMSR